MERKCSGRRSSTTCGACCHSSPCANAPIACAISRLIGETSRARPETQSGDDAETWREAIDREPTPEQAAVLAETVEQILAQLTPPERPIVELSLQGYSTREVSERLGRAERSVRRVRERVREQLEKA